MRGKGKYILVYTLLLVSVQVFPQHDKKNQKLFEKAREAYQVGNSAKAVDITKQILQHDNNFKDAHLFLADIYNKQDSIKLEIYHLKNALQESETDNKLIYYRIGEANFKLGQYKEALKNYEKCNELTKEGEKRKITIKDKIAQSKFSIELKKNPVSLPASALGKGVNTSLNEYWPSLTIDGTTLVFNRLIPDSMRGHKQEDFYSSHKVDGVWQEAVPMSEINTLENEGAQSLSADGKLLFFSACNRYDGLGSCDIYFSRFIDGKWQQPMNVGQPVNSSAWESQPSISANANYLYFASSRRGGKGRMDIWRCRLFGFNSKGLPEWGRPKNLGDSINTTGNELSPFIHFNGKTLFFSSDKWMGMGKKDIFYSQSKDNGNWSIPKNMGYPVNSQNDEQGLVVDAIGKTAYYSTDRIKENGLDIYSFNLKKEFQVEPVTYVKGVVLDKSTNSPIEADIDLVDIDKKRYVVKNISPDAKGEFLICLPLGKKYAFNVSEKGYMFHSETFELTNIHSAIDPIELKIYLQHIQEGLNMVLRNIYFETDSYELLQESKPEMDKLVEFLNLNPSVLIEIEGHTDKVGSEEYNMILSQKRAKSVFIHLVMRGISNKRLTFRGYGFSRPASTGETAYAYQLNRRTEIKITGIKQK